MKKLLIIAATSFLLMHFSSSVFAVEKDAPEMGAVAALQNQAKSLHQGQPQDTRGNAEVPFDEEQRYKNILEKVANSRDIKRGYTLKFVNSSNIAETLTQEWVYNDHARQYFPQKTCDIQLGVQPLRQDKLSDSAIAIVFGHELAHCQFSELTMRSSLLKYAEKDWNKEYIADAQGAIWALHAGFDVIVGLNELGEKWSGTGGASHPPMQARVAWLLGKAPMEKGTSLGPLPRGTVTVQSMN